MPPTQTSISLTTYTQRTQTIWYCDQQYILFQHFLLYFIGPPLSDWFRQRTELLAVKSNTVKLWSNLDYRYAIILRIELRTLKINYICAFNLPVVFFIKGSDIKHSPFEAENVVIVKIALSLFISRFSRNITWLTQTARL